MKHVKYTKAVLEEAVKRSFSLAGVLRALGKDSYSGAMGNWIRHRIEVYEIDTSHFTGLRSALGKADSKRRAAASIFSGEIPRSYHLRRALLEVGVPYKCSTPECSCSEDWLGKTLGLVVDHIDGNRKNNKQENLRFLCPNCHSQTPTFGRKRRTPKEDPKCLDCETRVSQKGRRCAACSAKARTGKYPKIPWPPIAELRQEISTSTRNAVAKRFGASFQALVKHLRKYP